MKKLSNEEFDESPPSFDEIEKLIVLKRHLKFIKKWWYLFE